MKNISFKMGLLIGSTLISLSAASIANAEDSAGEPQTNPIGDEIIVTGLRASLGRAISTKRRAQGVVDSISAEDLGKFPDLNLSESLQRVPGVTLNRNANGEGEAINLRGLAPQFTRVEINGLTALGNGADQNINGRLGGNGGGREFNFEILPAELFSNVVIAKTSSANQSEGGLAGVVSLETPRPLNHEGLKAVVSAQANYGDKADSIDPRLFATVSKNFDDKFGVAASLFYSDTTFRSDSIEGGTWHRLADVTNNVANGDPNADVLVARTPRLFSFVEDRENIAGTLDFQFKPNENLEFFVSGLYGSLTNARNVVRPDVVLEGGAVAAVLNDPSNPLVVENGIATQATFEGVQHRPSSRLTNIDDEFYQLSGGFDYTSNGWTISPYVGYSSRSADREFSLLSFRANDAVSAVRTGPDAYVTYNLDGDDFTFESELTDLLSNPEIFTLNVLIFRPTVDTDDEFTAKLDFVREFEGSALTDIRFGGRFNDHTKDVVAEEYRLRRDVLPGDTAGFGDVASTTPFNVGGSNDVFSQNGSIFLVDPDLYLDVYFPNGFNGSSSTGTLAGTSIDSRPGRGASRSYSVNEETINLYAEANFEVENVSFNAGVRYVDTSQTSIGSIVENQDQPSERINPANIKSGYTEFLPSMSARYEPAEDVVLRAAYSKTLTRANLPQLSPAETIFVPDATTLGSGTRGNPELLPFTSDNIDFGAEWYFEPEGFVALNVFHKDINDLIGTEVVTEIRTFLPQVGNDLVTGPVAFNVPSNAASANIKGFEFSIQKPFTFLPGEFGKNFGGLFNYTFADSSADFGIANDIRSDGLPGLSRNSYNASVYFDNGALDARLSYAWRSRYLAAFSDDFALPRFTDSYGQLDFSANYAISDAMQLQLQVLNITDSDIISQAFVPSAGFLPYGKLDITRRAIVGVRYSF